MKLLLKWLGLIVLFLAPAHLNAQDEPPVKTVYLELGGHGGFGSVNYNKQYFRPIGSLGTTTDASVSLPMNQVGYNPVSYK